MHRYANGTTGYGFEYDYFLKDHLGNTRMVLTQEKDTAQYIATMEAAYRATENQLFYNIPATSYARSAVSGYPTDNTTVPNDSLARVNGNGPKTDPSILLRVMRGDVVDVATKSFYKSGGTVQSPNSTLTDILNSLAGGIVTATSASHGVVSDLTNTSTSPIYAALNGFLPTNDPNTTGKPKAYLNWILLDDQFKGVNTYPQSGAIAVGSADVLNTLAYTGIPITKNGYLYIWVSNETPGWDVFFDNLSVKQYSGAITEETHYYPFGLTMQGLSSKALGKPENRYKYNGKELQHNEFSDGSGLEEYDYGARMHDPQIGRWSVIDPLSYKMCNVSPYVYCNNNLVRYIDPFGLQDEDGNETVRVKYMYNTKTGELTSQQVSEKEYQKNTNGGTTNVVQGNPGGGATLKFTYQRVDGTGQYETSKYSGTNTTDVALRDDKYQYLGAGFSGGTDQGTGSETEDGEKSKSWGSSLTSSSALVEDAWTLARAPSMISKNYANAAIAAGKVSAMEVLGKVTGAVSLYDDWEEGKEAWDKGNAAGVAWNITKAIATTTFLVGGGEEVELAWNLGSMLVDVVLDYNKKE